MVVTTASVHSAVLHQYPGFTAAQWHGVLAELAIKEIGALACIGVWLWLAWANSRGHAWATMVFGAFYGLICLSMLAALAQFRCTPRPTSPSARSNGSSPPRRSSHIPGRPARTTGQNPPSSSPRPGNHARPRRRGPQFRLDTNISELPVSSLRKTLECVVPSSRSVRIRVTPLAACSSCASKQNVPPEKTPRTNCWLGAMLRAASVSLRRISLVFEDGGPCIRTRSLAGSAAGSIGPGYGASRLDGIPPHLCDARTLLRRQREDRHRPTGPRQSDRHAADLRAPDGRDRAAAEMIAGLIAEAVGLA